MRLVKRLALKKKNATQRFGEKFGWAKVVLPMFQNPWGHGRIDFDPTEGPKCCWALPNFLPKRCGGI